MKKFRFRQFQVYKDALVFQKEIKDLSNTKFPREEQFCLRSQLWRATDSIVLNIAEGADRGTDKDFAHYLNNSHTSLNEVVACLDLAFNNKYINKNEHNTYLEKSKKTCKSINCISEEIIKFTNKIKNTNSL